MDPTCPLGLLLLQLLLMRNALGDTAPAPQGNKASEICLLPQEVGPCRARIPSYYYDRYTQSCRQFMYGGCEGNANNFETWSACNEACWRIEKVPKICRLEVSEGPCGESREEYFFNLSSMTCEKFMAGGCHSNENRFPDEATCMGFCAPKKGPSFCYFPKDEGLCSANVTRYYFNPRHRACQAFTYTGCGGNDNNFVNMKDCKHVCAKALKKKKIKKMTRLLLANRSLKIRKKQF
ncbi:PREDICTED: tissue factor pathway inhibitor 2 isoform X1 [Condylura cristata]|uniref:tissue factor pathway inhibitor 2 isoform X1 n=1 Tax=Condylura cristata TaxID=143302 RepID=UPI0003344CEC|nr:PREDICTED: tissue factor pathway inhibitor 2 isoform X1 [Condylura cristata]